MLDCKKLIHPFQNDPGVSQSQRIIEDLLSGPAKIDGRNLADLLDYFEQLSRHIKFYEPDLSVSDWQPFFQKSLPFSVAAISKFNSDKVNDKVSFYNTIFDKYPSASGLQLLVHYFYYGVINVVNGWHLQVKGSELPVEFALEKLIKDKLRHPAKEFIQYFNAAVKWYCIKPVDLQRLYSNEVWDLDISDLYAINKNFEIQGKNRIKKTIALRDSVIGLLQAFLNVMHVVADSAVLSLEKSLLPLKTELQEKHTPHLAILFAFLKLFTYLQNDLNSFTKKHLDFFYKQVLLLKTRDATPDKAHIIFEIQNQLEKYKLEKGLELKDGKDNNKAEVLFSLDDEIIVNKTRVAEKRTLFLNNRSIGNDVFVEGVYMAPDAGKADGVEKEFKDDMPKSFATLGAKNSKYADPEHKFIKPHPNARLGLILASPVLLLNEGHRTITINIACELKENICSELKVLFGSPADPCCEEPDNGESRNEDTFNKYPEFFNAGDLYAKIASVLNNTFYYISKELISEAAKKGAGATLIERLSHLLTEKKEVCYCVTDEKRYETVVPANGSAGFEDLFNEEERELLSEFFKPRKALNVLFSGEDGWLEPESTAEISITPAVPPQENKFLLTIESIFEPDMPAITFYDKKKLKEDLNTKLPVARIELDDKIKILQEITPQTADCCLENEFDKKGVNVSLYHFFRNLIIIDEVDVATDEVDVATNEAVVATVETGIAVSVCGLKNLIVQNDESLQDVNSPVYPFGTRPEIIDFDAVNPMGAGDKNLTGPDFYLGSKEIFLKKWEKICININWKNKPSNFNEYYKGYLVRDNYHTCLEGDPPQQVYGLNECDFEVNIALLENGQWKKELCSTKAKSNTITKDCNRELFNKGTCNAVCNDPGLFEHSFFIENTDFDGDREFGDMKAEILRYHPGSREGFLRLNLQNQDFLHKDYSFILARQMMAFGRYPDLIDGAVYMDGGVPQVFDISIFFGNIGPKILEIATTMVNKSLVGILEELINIITAKIDTSVEADLLNGIIEKCIKLLKGLFELGLINIPNVLEVISDVVEDISDVSDEAAATNQDEINALLSKFIKDLFDLLNTNLDGIEEDLKEYITKQFDDILEDSDTDGFFKGLFGEKEVVIPNEPWTPIIKEISLDYTASASITDIDLIHLYPYEGTFKPEEITLQPTLLPTFCDEGTLFLGLDRLVPGSVVNILFQLAEATADSESDRKEVHWYYLDNNQWKMLRTGFEVLEDATGGLTASGIIKFALPANMTSDNTILPKGLHWIKAAIPANSRSVSETIGIHSQAVQVSFTNAEVNDPLRLKNALPAGSIAKLKEADASVKKVNQPYDTFGGQVPETEGHFYVRVSELLRHKGRAIQKFDYEHLALEAFRQLFKVKCINHSFALDSHRYFNDLPVAPGYVLLAVIPDLNRLKAANSFEPRVPASLLEDIRNYLRERSSPFVRLRVMNPRYEKIHFCLKVKLYKGKDEIYYKEKLAQDLRELLAPWAIGEYDKLTFGQCIYRSDIIRFLESRDYLDYILDLRMEHEYEPGPPVDKPRACPASPRSILIAGDIDVCIQQRDCEEWQKCYDDYEREKDCCENEKILLADYCKDEKIE